MEVMSVAVWCGVAVPVVMMVYGWRIFNWVWVRPKRMEKSLREQGLTGSPYRFLFGDMKEMVQMGSQAILKPIKLTDSIIPRVMPFYYTAANTYGSMFFTWMGPLPMVHITDPPLIREILANYNQFQKQKIDNPLSKLLAKGIVVTEADQWVKHRKIINLAFHVEKLKINMIFHEVLRLYPPGIGIGRTIHEETKIGNLTLPSGSHVMMHMMLLHYDANIWGDDVNEFNPQRFAEGVANATKEQASYFPFGGGARIYVGQAFATLEARLALVMILRRFSFEISPSYSHAPHTILTLQPQFGARLILSEL
ncbi:hypothetical protein L1987_72604 [Smallanthus sonchifolius]|uniref:Uncharacterized protein n=1 Tax=Smallanthus sonchifolius TaxID=185202 RepID=A0ACB9AUS5_9ASTR|nr:hypothetical protein L1987_72604 [Smallanthus sonchifolius]